MFTNFQKADKRALDSKIGRTLFDEKTGEIDEEIGKLKLKLGGAVSVVMNYKPIMIIHEIPCKSIHMEASIQRVHMLNVTIIPRRILIK